MRACGRLTLACPARMLPTHAGALRWLSRWRSCTRGAAPCSTPYPQQRCQSWPCWRSSLSYTTCRWGAVTCAGVDPCARVPACPPVCSRGVHMIVRRERALRPQDEVTPRLVDHVDRDTVSTLVQLADATGNVALRDRCARLDARCLSLQPPSPRCRFPPLGATQVHGSHLISGRGHVPRCAAPSRSARSGRPAPSDRTEPARCVIAGTGATWPTVKRFAIAWRVVTHARALGRRQRGHWVVARVACHRARAYVAAEWPRLAVRVPMDGCALNCSV